jgi:formate dehydrogenase assembly factor FdhD
MIVGYERYKGENIIVLSRSETDRFPFSFGYRKAKLIVEHIEEIKKFIEEEEANERT